jgi:hypothetical protein
MESGFAASRSGQRLARGLVNSFHAADEAMGARRCEADGRLAGGGSRKF